MDTISQLKISLKYGYSEQFIAYLKEKYNKVVGPIKSALDAEPFNFHRLMTMFEKHDGDWNALQNYLYVNKPEIDKC